MPRTTLALKFGLYSPALIGALFMILSLAADGMKLRGGGFQANFGVGPGLLIQSALVLSYLAFGLPSFITGVLAAVFGPAIERWEAYQSACVIMGATLTGGGYLAFVQLLGAGSEDDKVLVLLAATAGAFAAAFVARLTRSEYEEAAKAHQARMRG